MTHRLSLKPTASEISRSCPSELAALYVRSPATGSMHRRDYVNFLYQPYMKELARFIPGLTFHTQHSELLQYIGGSDEMAGVTALVS